MEFLPPLFANASPARPVRFVDDLAMAALRGAARAVCKPFQSAELADAFDCTDSLTFPIETYIS